MLPARLRLPLLADLVEHALQRLATRAGGALPRLRRALPRDVDRQLATAGLRPLMIDPDSDQHSFAPVRAEVLAELDGVEGDGYALRSAPGTAGG